jgi:predicted transposase YdaD
MLNIIITFHNWIQSGKDRGRHKGGGRQRGESEGKKEGRDIQVVDGKRQRGRVKEEETERRDRGEEIEAKRQRGKT